MSAGQVNRGRIRGIFSFSCFSQPGKKGKRPTLRLLVKMPPVDVHQLLLDVRRSNFYEWNDLVLDLGMSAPGWSERWLDFAQIKRSQTSMRRQQHFRQTVDQGREWTNGAESRGGQGKGRAKILSGNTVMDIGIYWSSACL